VLPPMAGRVFFGCHRSREMALSHRQTSEFF
jgi:hypothetical protein